MKKPEEEEEPAICLGKLQLTSWGWGGIHRPTILTIL